jgi:hypothetical protein
VLEGHVAAERFAQFDEKLWILVHIEKARSLKSYLIRIYISVEFTPDFSKI